MTEVRFYTNGFAERRTFSSPWSALWWAQGLATSQSQEVTLWEDGTKVATVNHIGLVTVHLPQP